MTHHSDGLMLRIFGLPNEDRAGAARLFVERGFDSITVGAVEDSESVRPALDAGLRVWMCRASFTVRQLPDHDAAPLLARDVDGEPRLWFGSGCPNQPALRAAHLTQVRRAAEAGTFAGWVLDGIRFASPNAGDAFFTCFCDRCSQKAAHLGFDFELMRRDVRALRDRCREVSEAPLAADPEPLLAPLGARWPGVAEWLRFREACVREHVGEVRAAIDGLNLRGARFYLGAYLFAPTFAPLVGQDYGRLAPLLDQASPMLYRTLTPGDACITTEWAALAALRLVVPLDAFTPREVAQQVRLARERIAGQSSLVPNLQLADERLEETIELARVGGADGFDFYRYRTEDAPYLETASRGTRARI